MTSRNWLLTHNNPAMDCSEYLERIHGHLKAVYTVGQLEVGEEGTPHIQFFMNFKEPVRASVFKKYDKTIHFEKVSRTESTAADYCMKEKTRAEGPFEYGVKPVRRNNKTDWADVYAKAQAGDIDSLPADIIVRH